MFSVSWGSEGSAGAAGPGASPVPRWIEWPKGKVSWHCPSPLRICGVLWGGEGHGRTLGCWRGEATGLLPCLLLQDGVRGGGRTNVGGKERTLVAWLGIMIENSNNIRLKKSTLDTLLLRTYKQTEFLCTHINKHNSDDDGCFHLFATSLFCASFVVVVVCLQAPKRLVGRRLALFVHLQPGTSRLPCKAAGEAWSWMWLREAVRSLGCGRSASSTRRDVSAGQEMAQLGGSQGRWAW